MRCSLLLHSSLTPLPGQWDRRQSCKYTLGATFVIISQKFLIALHKSFARATIAHHNKKQVLWRAIAVRVAFYSRPGLQFESCEILNVYKLNFLNTTVFMHKIKNRTAPSSFLEKFEQPSHLYSTSFSSGNYRKPQIKLRKCRFRISIRGPAIWNDIVGITEKEIQSSSHFKTKIKMQTT